MVGGLRRMLGFEGVGMGWCWHFFDFCCIGSAGVKHMPFCFSLRTVDLISIPTVHYSQHLYHTSTVLEHGCATTHLSANSISISSTVETR
jgi:hypothetical protein